MNWRRGCSYMRGKQWWRRSCECRKGTEEVETSRGRWRLMESRQESRNCQSAGVLPLSSGRRDSPRTHEIAHDCVWDRNKSFMKWVGRLRTTRWVRCHFHWGCGYGAESDNEISASSCCPVTFFYFHPAKLQWLHGSTGSTGLKQLKTDTADHLLLFIVLFKRRCQLLWQISVEISVNTHLYSGEVEDCSPWDWEVVGLTLRFQH